MQHMGGGPGFHFSSGQIDLNDLIGGLMGAHMNAHARP
jgi:hypothetical protein